MEDRQFAQSPFFPQPQPSFLEQPQPSLFAQPIQPFVPQRRFFPLFFISPFFFQFARDDGELRDDVYAEHPVKEGDSAEKIATMYNIPQSIMELSNPHIQNFQVLPPGSTVYIPRMDQMYCQKMYLEVDVYDPVAPMYNPMQSLMQQAMPTMQPMQPMMQQEMPTMQPMQPMMQQAMPIMQPVQQMMPIMQPMQPMMQQAMPIMQPGMMSTMSPMQPLMPM